MIQRIFFIKRGMLILMGFTIFSIVANVLLDIYLSTLYSIAGIALSTSLLEFIYFCLLMYYIKHKYDINIIPGIRKSLRNIFISGLVMTTTYYTVLNFSPLQNTGSRVNLILSLSAHLFIGGLVYALSLIFISKKAKIFKITNG